MSTSSGDGAGRGRAVRQLRPLLTGLRAGTIAFAWVLVALGDRPVDPSILLGATVALVALFVWQALAPPRVRREPPVVLAVEPAVALVVVGVTGGWGSPFIAYLAVPIVAAAWVIGRPRASVDGDATEAPFGRVEQLSHVNALLTSLHDLVRSSPAPLTVEDVLGAVRPELDALFDADAVVLLLAGEGGRWWRPFTLEGVAVGQQVARSDLPPEVLADVQGRPVAIPRLPEDGGVTPGARSGVYLWLVSRGQRAALLVIEHREPRQHAEARLEFLERLAAPLGLAIDNAIWFQRLRTLGAEQERQRIGATLHDRFAQSLAYIGMELDRFAAMPREDGRLSATAEQALGRLRGDVRATLADLRETLRELRLRVTEDRGLVPTLADHVERFGDRFGVIVEFDHASDRRAPLAVENQVLRIVQDLLVLAQRESGATVIQVSLAIEPERLRVVVRDDGRGVPEDRLGHEASNLLALVRDRADAVGGLMDVVTRAGEGTEVAVTIRRLL